MELYFELLKKPVFSIADAELFYKHIKRALAQQ